jgi:hypothetical protein
MPFACSLHWLRLAMKLLSSTLRTYIRYLCMHFLVAALQSTYQCYLQEKLGRPDLAIPALRLAAGQGSPKALVTLGNFAYWGIGIHANSTHALQLFAAAGRLESAHGAFNCGMM